MLAQNWPRFDQRRAPIPTNIGQTYPDSTTLGLARPELAGSAKVGRNPLNSGHVSHQALCVSGGRAMGRMVERAGECHLRGRGSRAPRPTTPHGSAVAPERGSRKFLDCRRTFANHGADPVEVARIRLRQGSVEVRPDGCYPPLLRGRKSSSDIVGHWPGTCIARCCDPERSSGRFGRTCARYSHRCALSCVESVP